jgi:ABC-type amino acid transport substrate-binding protein
MADTSARAAGLALATAFAYHHPTQDLHLVTVGNRWPRLQSLRRSLFQHLLSWLVLGAWLVAAPLAVHAAIPVGAVASSPDGEKLSIDLNAPAQRNASIQAIIDSGVLRVGLAYPDNLPFYGHDQNGNLIGYDVDMARGMARALKVKPLFAQPNVTYSRLIQLVGADQVDLAIGKLSVTIPRLAYAEAVPYMNLRQSLLIDRRVLQQIGSDAKSLGPKLRDSSIRIGVISGSSHAVWGSTSFPKAVFNTYPNWQACVDALVNREVDALFRDGFETSRLVKSNPRLALDYVPVILEDRPDNVALFMGPRMNGLQASAQLFVNISTGVVSEEDLFRRFSSDMKRSFITLKPNQSKSKTAKPMTSKGADS